MWRIIMVADNPNLKIPRLRTSRATEQRLVSQILHEVWDASTKFPTWPSDPLHALAILGEEFGELTKEMVQLTYEPHKTNRDKVRKEALQTAAMSVRLLLSLDNYMYTPSHQHIQRTDG